MRLVTNTMGEKVIIVEEADLAKMNKSLGLKTRGHPVNEYFRVNFILIFGIVMELKMFFGKINYNFTVFRSITVKLFYYFSTVVKLK